jgi:hypothetical protein
MAMVGWELHELALYWLLMIGIGWAWLAWYIQAWAGKVLPQAVANPLPMYWRGEGAADSWNWFISWRLELAAGGRDTRLSEDRRLSSGQNFRAFLKGECEGGNVAPNVHHYF